MKKEILGYVAIILSSIVLSLELYGLKVIKYLEMKEQGVCYADAMRCAYEAPISIALLIPIFII
ncbi:hypothetical protein [uncultured Clostridium sp.]|uniref:hypothetical protein n=1 Tax=uncultured Clostridium sp. TaxID=59620 RepID=UPI002609BD9E|nr:hypothetical protein [uncultured Clostridium sp.]